MTAANQLPSARPVADKEAALPAVSVGFGNLQSFEFTQRAANSLASSTLVPEAFRKRIIVNKRTKECGDNPNALPNCIIALNMATRMGADPLMVMQNLYVVEGRPSWSSQFIIAAINSCGRFSPLRFDMSEPGPEREVACEYSEWENGQKVTKTVKVKVRDRTCRAWVIEKATGERLDGPEVSIQMAIDEGWLTKNGSKWRTMPEVMLRYRSASFFGKLYAPELLMGIQSTEEVGEILDAERDEAGSFVVNVTADPGRPTLADVGGDGAGAVDHDPETGEVTTSQDSQRESRRAEPGDGDSLFSEE
jgi:hypothetical protein